MKKGCLIGLIAALVLITIGLGYYFYSQNNKSSETFQSTKAEIRNILDKAVATGTIKPRLEVNVKSQVSGVVEDLYIEAGEIVKKGAKLAKIKLVPSEININSAQSSVELAQIQLRNSQRELERQRQIFSQKLDVLDAKNAFDLAELELKRSRSLFDDGVISEREFNQIELDYNLRKTALDNAGISSSNQLKQFEIQVDISKQELQAAKDNLALLKKGRTNRSNLVSNIVLATTKGMILDVPVEEGSSVVERNNFNEGTNIATIADMNSLIFEGKVDESDVGKLQEGMPIELTVGALPDEKFMANLEFIAPQGVEEEGVVKFKVKANILERENDNIFLRAGYSANGDIIIGRRDSVISVQERDIAYEDDKTYVEIVKSEQNFEKQEVELGLSDGLHVEVKSGLDTLTEIKLNLPVEDEKE